MLTHPPVISESAPLSIPELVPYYMMPPCPFTKAQAVHYIVKDRLGGGVARGKGSNARKRAQKVQYEALKRKREARGWRTWHESLITMKLERQKQLDGEAANDRHQPRDL
jgi:hypothetical protein